MPKIQLLRQGLDVFSFVDSDSDEAHQFTTYMVYWDALARTVTETFGATPADYHAALAADLQARKAYRRLSSTQFTGDEATLRKLLLNAWNSELGLYLVDRNDSRLMAQNQWNNVYAYYATGRAALAWLLVRDAAVPKRHRPLLRAMSAQVTGQRLFPTPWSCACTSLDPTWAGFACEPTAVSNLALSADCFDMTAKALKTTRKKRIAELKDARMDDLGVTRAPRGLQTQLDEAEDATTLFDFMWRSRTRSNYGDPSMFYMGTLSMARCRSYVDSVRTFTDATMFVLEALIAERARRVLVDAAIHYTSRDRSKITEVVLVPRLRALGLLSPKDTAAVNDDDDDEPW